VVGRAGLYIELTKRSYHSDIYDDQLALQQVYLRQLHYYDNITNPSSSSSSPLSSSSFTLIENPKPLPRPPVYIPPSYLKEYKKTHPTEPMPNSSRYSSNTTTSHDLIPLLILDWYQSFSIQLSGSQSIHDVELDKEAKKWKMKSTHGDGCVAHHSGDKSTVPTLMHMIRELYGPEYRNFNFFTRQPL